jgi:hypothetical protein
MRLQVMNIKNIARVFFAASALAFTFLMVCFFVVFVAFGLDNADKVWSGIYPVIAWLLALFICSKFLKRGRKE